MSSYKSQIEEIDAIIKHLGETRGIGNLWAMKIIQLLADYRKLLKALAGDYQ